MLLTAWGRYPRIQAQGCYFENLGPLRDCLEKEGETIVYGLGRSYGDSALNHRVIFSRRFNHILHFDALKGVVTCESGVSLAELIETFLPRGWFLAVTPGTRFVTLGGAIASDVHGKNHHQSGCFSQSVLSLELMLPGGEIVSCSPRQNRKLFLATCGGMGLTGVILSARLKLRRVPSAFIHETTFRARNLTEVFALCEEQQAVPYSVAWIDCLAAGDDLGRSLLMVGEFAADAGLTPPPPKALSIPVDLPDFLLNKYSMHLFNHLYYRRVPSRVRERTVNLLNFFYPLDAIHHWNRLYGRPGFTQYQLVLPKEASLPGLQAILRRVARAEVGAFLGTLKLFGPENENYLSFPLAGYTLAMDFKIQPKVFPLLDELDDLVLAHGGRLYLTKDVRMPPKVLRQGYPRWEKFLKLRETLGLKRKFNSLQSSRLEI